MVIHAETRKRDLVDKLYNLGLSISYDRVMNISTAMGNSICEMFKDDDVVCPAKLRCDVFTTAAVDNIDHNPSSTSAKGSLHGTAISLFQHPSQDNYGTVRAMTSIIENVKRDTIKPLPERYSVVPPVVLPKEPTAIPSVDSLLFSECGFFSGAQQLEYRWLNHVRQEIEDDDTDNKNVTWSAFHANLSQTHAVEVPPLDISSVLPLFQEEAKSTAMIRHSMTIIKEQYLDTVDDQAENTISFEEWKERRGIESPLFHFWSLTLKLELIILIFVRSLREGNFNLYKDSLTMLIPWVFALDHPNYARWLPIHVRDMFALDTIAPSIATEFESGHFVVHKTHSTFSAIAIDHAHEQNNKLVKGEGGVIGLTENASQLLRWMVCVQKWHVQSMNSSYHKN
ncbi:Hypothetical predicted protein [Mytilus galloprovincialis]|uniref:Uncharacterized protein n=1 Tax=Mytilus galloprovincialis TaxID=29158 RepID=A0A8B6DCJ8_MYTGA|nr:Hypothetical predicted protein [Mytilus galloprovincialis]